MPEYKIIMPSKPRIVLEEENKGVFEIDGLYPGYGHTLGNSLRRIILSSLPGYLLVKHAWRSSVYPHHPPSLLFP